MPNAALPYLDPASTMTLREGIAALRAFEADNDAMDQLAPELRRDVELHDAVHVLFACPTDVSGEVVAHVWTLLGTTARVRDMHRVASHDDHREVLRRIGHLTLLRRWLAGVPTIAATFVRAARMKRRWPAEQWASFLDQPLNVIRAEYGIRLPRPSRRQAPSEPGRHGAALRSVRARPASA